MNPWIDMQPGIRRRTLASGEHVMQVIVTLAAGSALPGHAHVSEQMAHVVSGKLVLTINGERHECGPGASILILSGVPHSAEAPTDTVVLDTFSPPRADMLAQDEQHRKEQSHA